MKDFVTAVAYHFCLNLPEKYSQPGDHFLAHPCRRRMAFTPSRRFGEEPSLDFDEEPPSPDGRMEDRGMQMASPPSRSPGLGRRSNQPRLHRALCKSDQRKCEGEIRRQHHCTAALLGNQISTLIDGVKVTICGRHN